ncbi:uncharacterized protein LOC130974762 [Arachis stenosperma]|uniref:uncharacterized protein LOC130974762 n=1 Tax=Arachis stenosperma TaxID=217475 RepID=UPI0025AB75FB|nr:uncharacterized protein LOC130974762 [Arachis stenosperma]
MALATNVSAQISSIPMLNGSNFKVWKDTVEIVLGCMDLDIALREEKPTSTPENLNEVKIEKWERSNRMSIMIMKHSIHKVFRGSITENKNAKQFLKDVEKFFTKNEKAEASSPLNKLVSMRYKGKGNIREYIMETSHLASKLKALKLELSEDLLMHFILIFLPAHFGQFKVSYNTLKDTWSLNELISHCVQEEERLQQDKTESAHMALSSHYERKRDTTADAPSQQKKAKKQDQVSTCFFYKKDCLWSQPPSHAERYIYVADSNIVAVEAIGTFRLCSMSGIYLDLLETLYVPSFRRNLVSVSRLDKSGYFCLFGDNKVSLVYNSNNICSGHLVDNLYRLNLNSYNNEILKMDTKQKLNENLASLWHKRLGHISKQRIQRLVSDEILGPLNLADFEVCIECIKEKRTNKRKLGAERAKDVLELIHTDIYGPFPTVSWNGQRYFITFINDYSRYRYLYLIHEKSQALDVFKSFKAEVELKLGKKIKAVKSDRGG